MAGGGPGRLHLRQLLPTSSGTYADLLVVTVTGVTATATSHGVTGLALGGGAPTCTSYQLGQEVARFDLEVVGIDPGERFTVALNGAPYPLTAGHRLANPYVSAQPVVVVGGGLVAATGAGPPPWPAIGLVVAGVARRGRRRWRG